MVLVNSFIGLIAAISLLLLVAGLINPWHVLWWRDIQNRKGVILLYGTISSSGLLLYFLIESLVVN